MSNLTIKSALFAPPNFYNGLAIEENNGVEIVSLTIANNHETDFLKHFKTYFRSQPPPPTEWIETKAGKVLWMGQNQYFIFDQTENVNLDTIISNIFEESGYTTLQTDGWTSVRVFGDEVYSVLERFIPLDLRNEKPGFGTRTTAHHMAVIVLKTDKKDFTLLTPRSSSRSFIEALHSVSNHVLGQEIGDN